ncbi:hypothetical protein VP01_2049g3 [Puccinia sorghi]|uniref:Uncharacterized protein n=1 Tax=Puccinia sorghi TaxID=27349 RepID=A0A0L6VAY3_9BASI|nr:hypothetical protein VP01_2049g3 [Puccinia sorghi]
MTKTQDMWLGPSQPNEINQPAVKLFYKAMPPSFPPSTAAKTFECPHQTTLLSAALLPMYLNLKNSSSKSALSTLSSSGNHIVTQDSDFPPFEAMKQIPTSKFKIKITMEDPNKSARNMKQEKAQEDSLALSYGPEEDQLALERTQARLAANATHL